VARSAAVTRRLTGSSSTTSTRAPTPLVALTAHADPALRARCAAAGIAECLVKPVGREALGVAVDRWARVAAPAPAAALDPAVVARLRDLEGDAPGLLARVAADYAAGSARRLDEIARAAAAGEQDALARAAHALRGASASAGAARAAACADAVARAAGDASAVARLRVEVARAAAALAELAASAEPAACAGHTPPASPGRHTPAQPGAPMCRYCDTERPRAGSPPVRLIPPGSST
jgi:CheY-like chemotaxis protein